MYAPLPAGRGEIVTAFVTYTPYVIIIIIIIIILQLSNIVADRNFPPPLNRTTMPAAIPPKISYISAAAACNQMCSLTR